MIPEFNKINFEEDTISVIEAKIKAINEGVENGTITEEERDEEKRKLNEKIAKYEEKVGYSFTW